MADIEKIKVGNTSYDVRDASAAHSLTDIATAGNNITFTEANSDNVSATDKKNGAVITSSGLFYPPDSGSAKILISSNSITGYTSSIYTGSYDWSIKFRFKIKSGLEYYRLLQVCNDSDSSSMMINYLPGDSTLQFSLYGMPGVSGWLVSTLVEQVSLDPDKEYSLRFSRNVANSLYKLEVSEDESSWITAATVSSSSAVSQASSKYKLAFEGDWWGVEYYNMTGVSFETSYQAVSDWVAFVTSEKLSISVNTLVGSSAPVGNTTAGVVGQVYVDTTNKDAYICVESNGSSTYTWKKITP